MPLSPDARALVDVLEASAPAVETLTPTQARRASDERRAQSPMPVEEVLSVADRTVDGPAGPLTVRVYRPADTPDLPAIVFFHGGGWVLCDLDSHDGLCRALANRIGAVVVSVDYRRAPEDRYPAAFEDCYAAWEWVARSAAELGVDPARLAVMGDSAGGNLAAAVTLAARDRRAPQPALQVLLYPVIDADFARASYRAFGRGYYLTEAAMRWYWDQYVAADERRDPYVAPIHSPDLAGLAPAIVLVAECDPLHDEGIAYAERLDAAGVPVRTVDVEGGFHGFLSLAAVLPEAKRHLGELAEAVRSALVGR